MRFTDSISPRLKNRLCSIMSTGMTPHKTALTLCIGITIGIMPVPWGATPLCALVALILGLNQAGIQAANYLAYPLQIALFVPFYKMGDRFVPFAPPPSTDGSRITRILLSLCGSTGKALLVWLVVAPLLATGLYLLFHPLLRRRIREHSVIPETRS